MKIVIYTLNANGTIPDYIIDGGYFPKENTQNSPQNLDVVGVATNECENYEFIDFESFSTYVKEFTPEEESKTGDKSITLDEQITLIWSLKK